MRRRVVAGLAALAVAFLSVGGALGADSRPNILLCIADDASWHHFGANGDKVVRTPNFDRVAREGVNFRQAFCSSPSCTPSRGALLTGQHFWRLEDGGNLWSRWPNKFAVYPDLLAKAGYHVGLQGKGWGPGDFKFGGREHNPAGPPAKDFATFLKSAPKDKPFCFWFGSTDPHRLYERGSGVKAGLKIADVTVPPYLPDTPGVRSDILDYYAEIERFDRDVGAMLKLLEDRDDLDNTLVVITSDNGWPFPRGKATCYDAGTRMPLAIRWPAKVKGGRVVDDFVSLTDLAPTFLEAADSKPPVDVTGHSLLSLLASGKSGQVEPSRNTAFFGRERHANVRAGNVGYPVRAIRTRDYLYLINFKPDRWPAGDPPIYGDVDQHLNIDGSPTKQAVVEHGNQPSVKRLFDLAFGKRPAEELYDLNADPWQTNNVAAEPQHAGAKGKLRVELERRLAATGDPRAGAEGDVFDRYFYVTGANRAPRRSVVSLHASNAVVHGTMLRYEPQTNKNCLGYWTKAEDWAEWTFEIKQPGEFEVEVWQGCGKGQGGSEVAVEVGGKRFDFGVEETGHFQIFLPRKLGPIQLLAGTHSLAIKPQRKKAGAVMDIRQVRLVPVEADTKPPRTRRPGEGPVDADGRPLIRKLGTVDLDLVETTPLVLHDRLWRFEWARQGIGQQYWDNKRQTNYFRFRDPANGEVTAPFADGHEFGSAFVNGDMVYVTGTLGRSRVNMFASRDLKAWETWPVLDDRRYGIFNTSICKAGDEFVLMFEIDKPREEAGTPFTARFAKSPDLRSWTLTPPECNYSKDRYTAPHALRWLDGWFYNFYLEAHQGYEMRVVRSRDLVKWEASPLNPVLRHSPEDKRIANPKLTDAQRTRVAHAMNLNNSDIDFCEWQGGLIITYSWGNQQGVEYLAEAVYEGSLEQFLKGWFLAD